MPEKKEMIDKRQFFSNRISTQVRLISFSLLATTWGFLIGEIKGPKEITSVFRAHLIK